MTMGTLRVGLLLAYLATSGVLVWGGAAGESAESMVAAALVSAGLLAVPTLLVGRIRQGTPVSSVGIAPVSALVFVLGMAAPALLVLQPWLGGAAFVLLLVAFVVLWRRAAAALESHPDVLRPSAGDGDVGVFTALTPLAPPPTVVAEPTAAQLHSRYDATAVRDQPAGSSRRRQPVDRRGSDQA